jgi:hypothetical protein
LEFFAVQLLNSLSCTVVRTHLNKREAFASAAIAISDDAG